MLSFQNFFPPPPPFICSQLHALRAWAHAECASLHARAFARNLSREIERWPEAVPARRRDNEEDSSFHGNLSYGPLWWPFAVLFHETSLGSEARNEKYHFNRASSPCYTLRWVSFPARYRGNFAIPCLEESWELLTYVYVNVIRIFSSREDFCVGVSHWLNV